MSMALCGWVAWGVTRPSDDGAQLRAGNPPQVPHLAIVLKLDLCHTAF